MSNQIKVRNQLEKVVSNKNSLTIFGRIILKEHEIAEAKLLLLSRGNVDYRYSYEVKLNKVEGNPNENVYLYSSMIYFKNADDNFVLDELVYDVFLDIKTMNAECTRVRVGKPTLKTKLLTNETKVLNSKLVQMVRPYYTFKRQNLSLEIFLFPLENYRYLKKVMRLSWIYRLLYIKKRIWIVGELPYKAQDTGYHFFKYMRENHPEKNVYYVINTNSPEKKNIEKLGNILDFKSKKHILYTIVSRKVISSHHPDYLYPIRTKKFKKKVKAVKVFLQHGVLGTKNMTANYGKYSGDFDVDLFFVSSDYERKIVINDLNYGENQVKVTGLSRFDALFSKDVSLKRQILIIPTWRDWLSNNNQFKESEYFNRYNNLINNKDLLDFARENEIQILFCIHPNMQQFTGHFESGIVKCIKQGEINVQTLIKESLLMITDYSSVAFDFSFLRKPVIYYQFDRDRFLDSKPSHIDIEEELPGDIVYEEVQLIELIKKYKENNFRMKELKHNKSQKFLKFNDMNSNQRILNAIVDFRLPEPRWVTQLRKYLAIFKQHRKK
ncbi:CDP-glycerol glycerophosphotransferase family protein [Ornithinibacillus xuwenensis]|uniref:CDP-glycerol glycerophosphotransferase family protein n=1 Tax=Ornithinibacillus xuwenensis TaxID=3144668 RepID=A0ABU9XGE5_9BACI